MENVTPESFSISHSTPNTTANKDFDQKLFLKILIFYIFGPKEPSDFSEN